MLDKLKTLQSEAEKLEPNTVERAKIRDLVVGYTEQFLAELPVSKGYNNNQAPASTSIFDEAYADEGIDPNELISRTGLEVDVQGINPASGNHLGYVPGGGLYTSSLGDYWADITNRYAGIFYANPGAVRLENSLIRWLSELVGYGAESFGNLASGGSIANLIAIVTAREAYNIVPANIEKHVVYCTDHAHHCIKKALKIAGLESSPIRYISMNHAGQMDIAELESTITLDTKSGLIPWLLIGSAGTTDLGAIDPLSAMADLAKDYQLWFHVDAAYGGFFLLVEDQQEKFEGIERSDSVVLDPHKGLFIPYGLGTVLVRDGNKMKSAFAVSASYLQDINDVLDPSPADVSPELTKHFRGLRLWLPLKIHGLGPFRAALSEKILLAQYFTEKLLGIPGFELQLSPELSIVAFRYVPEDLDPNQFNQRLTQAIHEDGRVFLSTTTIDGVFVLRLAILVFRTHINTIDLCLEILEQKVQILNQQLNSKLVN